jgi:hypothetical protein
MGPRFTVVVGLLQHGGSHSHMGPWFSTLLQHYGPQYSWDRLYNVTSLIKSVEDNVFIRGVDWIVDRELM